MGAIINLIKAGLTWGGSAAIGYFFNDLATWLASATGQDAKVRNDDGGFKAWYVVVVLIVGGILVHFAMKLISGRKKLFTLLLLSAVHFGLGSIAPTMQDITTAGLLFSIAASVTDTKQVAFVPQFFTFNIGTVPDSIKIEVNGDGVIFALDATGVTNLNGIRLVGELPSGQYVYRIADGFVNKSCSFTIDNAHAGQLDVYGWSEGQGTGYIMHNQDAALANSTTLIDDFFYAAFPSAAATDTLTVTWRNGKTENMTRLELVSRLAQMQEVVSTRYNIDNINRVIKKLQFTGAAAQTVYYTRWNPARGTVRQTLN